MEPASESEMIHTYSFPNSCWVCADGAKCECECPTCVEFQLEIAQYTDNSILCWGVHTTCAEPSTCECNCLVCIDVKQKASRLQTTYDLNMCPECDAIIGCMCFTPYNWNEGFEEYYGEDDESKEEHIATDTYEIS
jgi:hypothetical protein